MEAQRHQQSDRGEYANPSVPNNTPNKGATFINSTPMTASATIGTL